MALTPEDVVNKRFQPTKFREGYDQDEVDDFLDEVVVELRRLTQESDELKQRLVAADSRIAELQRSGGAAPAAPVAAAPAADNGEVQRLQQENDELKQRLAAAQRETEAARQQASATPAAAAGAAAGFAAGATDANDPNATNNLLQLARRLHEEHVREGVEKRDALIAEGHATAARIVAEAESKQRAQISALDQERSGLERRIDELRTFERDYRQGLKGYIEGQLRDLDSQSVAAPSGFGQGRPAQGTGSVPTPVPAGSSDANSQDQGAQPPVFPGFGG
ncbi:MAG: DivIVA domain-containing protein [Actinobacteria bacterium]|nr:DivIVA domain-containing protein [Actinomycetota bacterium]